MPTRYKGTAREVRALDAMIKLMRCADSLEAHLKPGLAEHGLTASQLAVLEALLHLGRLTQKELARKMLRTGGSVTSVVDTLERKGWVRRERDEDDRRLSWVSLTPGGRRLIRRVFPGHVARITEGLGALDASEQAILARLCAKLGLALARR